MLSPLSMMEDNMDAQFAVSRELLEQIVFDQLKPDDDAELVRVVYDTHKMTLVFSHPTMEGPYTILVYSDGNGGTTHEFRPVPS